jgi:hypothetical protein
MKSLITRGSTLLAAVTLATAGLALAPGAPAGAATPVQKCTKAAGTGTITPGLSTTPHDQVIKATMSTTGCTPAAKTGGSGKIAVTLKLKAGSCQGLVKGGQTIPIPSATETWKNGKKSTYHLTAKTGTGSAATLATITGTVSSGLFARKHVSVKLKITTPSSENCTPGHPVKHITLKNATAFVIS